MASHVHVLTTTSFVLNASHNMLTMVTLNLNQCSGLLFENGYVINAKDVAYI